MRRKTVWLAMSCLMVAALVLSSCASADEEEEVVVPEEEVAVVEGGGELTPEELQAMLLVGKVEETEKPKYGGEISIGTPANQSGFDDSMQGQNYEWTVLLSNEEMLIGDWAKGPAGTGETGYRMMYMLNPTFWVGALAES